MMGHVSPGGASNMYNQTRNINNGMESSMYSGHTGIASRSYNNLAS